MARIVLAMSGGVDSSVAAHLLRAEGHEVIGVFMRHGEQSPAAACDSPSGAGPRNPLALPVVAPPTHHKQGCCTASDAADARRVAELLDIPFYALNFADEFGRIMDYFVDEYSAGRTPNPCVVCNIWLKFGKLTEYADSVGAEFVATGHYARLQPRAGEPWPALLRGVDSGKDQSYVLFGIDRATLPRMLFPVGGRRKQEIRAIAAELGFDVAQKKDSQEICFVPDGNYAAFVRRRRGESDLSGEIVTTDGQVIGRHDGLEQFTIGQRKGLGVALGEPRYVVRLERERRRVVIGRRDELACDRFSAAGANWLVDRPTAPLECRVKIRYLSEPAAATVTCCDDDHFDVVLHEPRDGVAPGQAAVCYDGDRVLGGGWIE